MRRRTDALIVHVPQNSVIASELRTRKRPLMKQGCLESRQVVIMKMAAGGTFHIFEMLNRVASAGCFGVMRMHALYCTCMHTLR